MKKAPKSKVFLDWPMTVVMNYKDKQAFEIFLGSQVYSIEELSGRYNLRPQAVKSQITRAQNIIRDDVRAYEGYAWCLEFLGSQGMSYSGAAYPDHYIRPLAAVSGFSEALAGGGISDAA